MNVNKAQIYAENLDKETIKQFNECCKEEYVVSASLMPDAHLGYAAPIGAVLATKGFVVPAWVGFDIGCGVLAVKLKGKDIIENINKNAKKIHKSVSKAIPLGKGQKNSGKIITENGIKRFNLIFNEFKKSNPDKQMLNLVKTMALTQLGTLGGGNHFIEIDSYKNEAWVIIHSGSRGLGHKIASHYMKLAAKLNNKENSSIEQTFPLDINTKEGINYMKVQDFCLKFAILNREEMSLRVLSVLEKIFKKKIKSELWVNNNHNHVVFEKGLFVHRKGATPAHKNERGVIPANMRDGVLLVVGKGSKEFLNSSSHGAGRKMSRRVAKERFSLSDLKNSMEGITANIEDSIIDEIPMAYKDIDSVMSAQEKSVKIIKHLKPLINWKGTETNYLD